MNYPLISIVIATLNSEKTLIRTLTSIKKQTYPKTKTEILIVDAGSTDKTLEIAKKYHTKIYHSPKIENTYAKQLGFKEARGKYLMYLDSDEVLENKKSLEIKLAAFYARPLVKMTILSGYKTPKKLSPINYYINEFGDPFSFFMYREGKGNTSLIKDIKNKYKKSIVTEDPNSLILNFSNAKKLPLIEMFAGGCMIDLAYFKSTHIGVKIKNEPDMIPHLFYILTKQKKYLAITKNDNTIHYSSASFRKYLKKIASRIKFNVAKSSMGKGGFTGRESFMPNSFRVKKILFIPYSFSIILPLIDSFYLWITRKKIIFMTHWILCFYTACIILYYYIYNLLGMSIKIEKYGK